MTYGIDTNTNTTTFIPALLATPLPGTIAPEGATVSFVGRYLGRAKKAEIDALGAAGFQIVSILEHDSNHADYFTSARGLADGAEAARLAAAVGQPTGTPVYFAVDYDDANWYKGNFANVVDYLTGVNSAMATAGNPYAIGVYSPGGILEVAQARSLATFFWQAFGSGMYRNKTPFAGANLRQISSTSMFPGTSGFGVDYDVADNDAPGSWAPATAPSSNTRDGGTGDAGTDDGGADDGGTRDASADTSGDAALGSATASADPGDGSPDGSDSGSA